MKIYIDLNYTNLFCKKIIQIYFIKKFNLFYEFIIF